MKISELNIDGFGRFSDAKIPLSESPVVILYGPNEAGKSTLLEFIRTVLFGFPRQNRDQHYPALNGGRHGGRIAVTDDSGNRYVIERHAGVRGGPVSVQNEAGQALGDAGLNTLRANATKDVFESIFAFSLEELQNETSLQKPSVNDQIYSAGLGASKLPAAFDSLSKRSADIFAPRAQTRKVNGLISKLKDVDSKLDEIKDNASEYARLVSRRNEIEVELEDLRTESSKLNDRRRNFERIDKAWIDWIELDYTIGPGLSNLQHLNHAIITAPFEHEAILADGEAINAIVRTRDAYDKSIREQPATEAELSEKESSFSRKLADLNADWDESRLESLNTSFQVQNEINLWKDRVSDKSEHLRQSQDDLRGEQSALSRLDEAESEAQTDFQSAEQPELSQDEIRVRRQSIITSDSNLIEYERQRDKHSQLQSQLNMAEAQNPSSGSKSNRSNLMASITLIVFGLIFGVAAFVLGRDALFVGLPAGALIIALGIYFSARNGPSRNAAPDHSRVLREQVSEASVAENRALDDFERGAIALNIERPDRASIDAAKFELTEIEEIANAFETLRTNLSAASRDTERQRTKLNGAKDAVKSVQLELDTEIELWRDWLRQLDLPDRFTPETMVEFWSQAEIALLELRSLKETRQRVRATKAGIREFRDLVEPIAKRHSVAITNDHPVNVTTASVTLEKRLQAALDDLGRREEHLQNLRQLSGPGEQLTNFLVELSQTTRRQLDEDLLAITNQINQLKDHQNELREERGGVNEIIGQLAGEKESSKLRLGRNALVEQLREQAAEWARLRIAEDLLSRARDKFQKERQPDVVRHAQAFFSTVTGNRYERINTTIGEKTITVVDSSGSSKQPDQLSRGTREQLYLALRFGLIREFGNHAEPLPVIVDEVLVNFDPERARRAAEGFATLSKTNQILVFTCHPEMINTFEKACKEALVIDVNSM